MSQACLESDQMHHTGGRTHRRLTCTSHCCWGRVGRGLVHRHIAQSRWIQHGILVVFVQA